MTTITLKKFAISGDNIMPFKQTEGSIVDAIPAGLYVVKESLFGYYLEKKADKIPLPEKIYGSTMERAKRCYDRFDHSPEALTVGLFGSKGAGKTLLANVLAQQGIERGMPVIDVSASFCIDKDYLEFIESLGSVVVLFDEFLKRLSNLDLPSDDMYNGKQERAHTAQDNMLTFLQGTNNAKRLTVLIDNSADLLSDYIDNRPGRMRYRYDYRAIEPAVVQAVCADAGLTAEQTEQLVVYTQHTQTTFDILRVIVEEWLFFPTAPLSDITDVLNVPSTRSYEPATYSIKVLEESTEDTAWKIPADLKGVGNGGRIALKLQVSNPFIGHPIIEKDNYYDDDHPELHQFFNGYGDYTKNRLKPSLERSVYLDPSNMIGYSGMNTIYQLEDGTVVEATPDQRKLVTRRSYSSADCL